MLQRQAGAETARLERLLQLRLAGRDQVLALPWPEHACCRDLQHAFGQAYRRRFGHLPGGDGAAQLVVDRLTLQLCWPAEPLAGAAPTPSVGDAPQEGEPIELYGEGVWRAARLWQRAQLQPEQRLEGPALIAESTGTILLPPGWLGRCLPGGSCCWSAGQRRAPRHDGLRRSWLHPSIRSGWSCLATASRPSPSRWARGFSKPARR